MVFVAVLAYCVAGRTTSGLGSAKGERIGAKRIGIGAEGAGIGAEGVGVLTFEAELVGDVANTTWGRHDVALADNVDGENDVEGGRSLARDNFDQCRQVQWNSTVNATIWEVTVNTTPIATPYFEKPTQAYPVACY